MRISIPLARPGFIGFVAIYAMLGNCVAAISPQELRTMEAFDWDSILGTYNAYLNYPSQANALALLASLPRDRPNEIRGNTERAFRIILSGDNDPIIFQEAISGDRTAIEIYFRLLNLADGYYLDIVNITMGFLVRFQPKLFLENLLKYRDTQSIKTHGYPILTTGPGYNTHKGAWEYVLGRRIAALEAVNGKKYSTIKAECIKLIRETIVRNHTASIHD